jgi:hypothetical protein
MVSTKLTPPLTGIKVCSGADVELRGSIRSCVEVPEGVSNGLKFRSRPTAGRLLDSDAPGAQGGFHLASTHPRILPGDVKIKTCWLANL